MGAIIVVPAIIAVTELIKNAVPKVSGPVTVLVAVLIGGFAGFFNVEGLNLVTGILVGLGATGIHTVATRMGGTN